MKPAPIGHCVAKSYDYLAAARPPFGDDLHRWKF